MLAWFPWHFLTFLENVKSVILGTLQSKYSFAEASSVIEALFNFDNIHNLNFLETQVLVFVCDLAPVSSWSSEKGLVYIYDKQNICRRSSRPWTTSAFFFVFRYTVAFGEGELGPHLTQCGRGRGLPARRVSIWSVQLFGHSARTSQTGQTGQDRQTDRQRSDSIGRTVLQTVAQNCAKIIPIGSGVFDDVSSQMSNALTPRRRFGGYPLALTPKFNLIIIYVIMVALCNRADHYIFMLFLLSSLFFPRLISAVGDWMFTIHWNMVWP